MEYSLKKGYENLFLFTNEFKTIKNHRRIVDKFKRRLSNDIENKNEFVKVVDYKDSEHIQNELKNIKEMSYKNPLILCSSGSILLSVISSLKKLEENEKLDIGIIGFDDYNVQAIYDWANLNSKSITRVVPNWYELGIQAMILLQDRLLYPTKEPKTVVIESEFIEGDTTPSK